MKKKLITIFLIVAAVCALGVGAIAAHAENRGTDGDTAETRLFLPSSYEQYLELENPSDFAVNERYIAVADKQENSAVFYMTDKAISRHTTYIVTKLPAIFPLSISIRVAKGTIYFLLKRGITFIIFPYKTFPEGAFPLTGLMIPL